MTTARQTRLLMKPLVDGSDDLAMSDGWVVLQPITHFARGILLDRTSDKDHMRPRWSVAHLFEPLTTFHLSLGQLIYGSKTGLWQWSNPNLQRELLSVIESSTLPMLRSMNTLDKYVEHLRGHVSYALAKRPLRKIIVDIAMGDFDAARVICRDVISRYTLETFPGDAEDKAHFADLKKLCAMLAADDSKGMAAMLHAWEAHTVKNLKLEHLWEPTPFPFELAAH